MKNVLIATPFFLPVGQEVLDVFENAGLTPIFNKDVISDERQVLSLVNDDTVAIINASEPVGELVMQAAKGLKVVSSFGAGINAIDVNAAKKHKINVVRAAGANRNAVADLAIGLMIAISRQITFAEQNLRSGLWKRYIGKSLYRSTLGIVGFGAIGKEVAKRAKGFEMEILAFDTFWDTAFAEQYGVERCELDDLMKRSDFVSIHVALTPETRHLINGQRLRFMKPTSYIINTARGDIIDENGLFQVLKERAIAGAALDTFSEEPFNANNPLGTLDNVILTPHIGGDSEEAKNSVSLAAVRNIVAILSGNRYETLPPWLVYQAPEK